MKYVFLLLFMPSLSWAAPFVCLTEKKTAGNSDGGYGYQLAGYSEDADWASYREANLRCEDTSRWERRLNWVSLSFGTTGLIAACTGFGAGLTIPLEGAAIVSGGLALLVGGLPCDNRTRDAEIKAMAEQVACEHLAKQGNACIYKYQLAR